MNIEMPRVSEILQKNKIPLAGIIGGFISGTISETEFTKELGEKLFSNPDFIRAYFVVNAVGLPIIGTISYFQTLYGFKKVLEIYKNNNEKIDDRLKRLVNSSGGGCRNVGYKMAFDAIKEYEENKNKITSI